MDWNYPEPIPVLADGVSGILLLLLKAKGCVNHPQNLQKFCNYGLIMRNEYEPDPSRIKRHGHRYSGIDGLYFSIFG
jgi:hypothetical protein